MTDNLSSVDLEVQGNGEISHLENSESELQSLPDDVRVRIQSIVAQANSIHGSPLPTAEELERLERTCPGVTERLLDSFEAQRQHRHDLEMELARHHREMKMKKQDSVLANLARKTEAEITDNSKLTDAEIVDMRQDRTERRTGQYLGFLIGVIAIIAGGITAAYGQPITGGLIGASGVIGLVAVFVFGRWEPNSEVTSLVDRSADATP